ncbi:hypothetical protein [Bacteroides propionicifaciens]|uniref:hypothetical protein n=1 Tax=Bacteroides propionicifaciens TaxID=392838 RepID=UPI000365EEBB|nr:hypothetical protein [Bacteroides propionicifaciens]
MDTNKRILGLLAFLVITLQAFAYGDTRREARFLTDKMMYELRLSSNQYIDIFEINYDFLASVAPMRNAIVQGDPRAMDSYYSLLDNRNQDISWVLSTSQYRRYSGLTYFYRPISVQSGAWSLRVYFTYTNHNHYYYGPPANYRTYNGRYHRRHGNNYYYRDRHNSSSNRRYRPIYSNNRRYRDVRQEDFGYRDQRNSSSSRRNGRGVSRQETSRNNRSGVRSNTDRRHSDVPTYRVNNQSRENNRRSPGSVEKSNSNKRVSTRTNRSSSRSKESGTSRRRTNTSSSSSRNSSSGAQVI